MAFGPWDLVGLLPYAAFPHVICSRSPVDFTLAERYRLFVPPGCTWIGIYLLQVYEMHGRLVALGHGIVSVQASICI